MGQPIGVSTGGANTCSIYSHYQTAKDLLGQRAFDVKFDYIILDLTNKI